MNEGAFHHIEFCILLLVDADVADVADDAWLAGTDSDHVEDEVVDVLAANGDVVGADRTAGEAFPVQRVVRHALQHQRDAIPGEDDGGGNDEVLQEQRRAREGGELPEVLVVVGELRLHHSLAFLLITPTTHTHHDHETHRQYR